MDLALPGPSSFFVSRQEERREGREEKRERGEVGHRALVQPSLRSGGIASIQSHKGASRWGELTGVVEDKDKMCCTPILGILERQPRCIRHVYQTRRPHSSSEHHGDVGYRSVNL